MQVKELESKGLKKSFQIIVGADAIKAKKENELKAVGKNAKIAGFRPGQVPLKILEQRYGKAVQADVIKQVINGSVNDLVVQNKFRPTLTPQVSVEDYNEGGELSFKVAIELFPELPELSFDGLEIERKTFEISQSDIEEALAKIAERSPQFVDLPKSAKAADGNIVKIDFKGTLDGVAFDGGAAEDFDLELGSKQFIDTFEDQLVGAKAGDKRTVKVTFPAKYPSAQLAGKAAEFEVTVKSVQEAKAPEINEEFATDRGFADLNALHETVRAQMTREYDQIVRNQMKKQLFDILEEKHKFELPENMVEMEFKTIWERLQQSMDSKEALEGKEESELEEEYKKVARRRVKLGILLAEVGTRNKIQINREELSRAVMAQAQQYPGQERQIFEFYQKNPNRLEDLRGPILEEKAVDFILSKVKFSDVKTPLAELVDVGDDEESEEKPKKSAKSTNSSKTKSKKKASE
ncbi:MAG: trigger factor [Rickettsiales bacterium]